MNIKELKSYIKDLPDDMIIVKDHLEWTAYEGSYTDWYEIITPNVIDVWVKNTNYWGSLNPKIEITYKDLSHPNLEIIKALYV